MKSHMCLIIMFIILTLAVFSKNICTTNPPIFCKAWHYFLETHVDVKNANYKHATLIQYYNTDT
jgi:hypothetical protein